MHELPVTESILEIALRHATQAGAARVTDLNLVIGQLSSLVDDSIQFYWDIIAKGTIAEGAQLHFKRISAELLCLDCGNRYPPGDEILACPQCQSVHIKVAAGDEFRLDSIDIDPTDVPNPVSSEKIDATKHSSS
jgi:hydrogenase nickel incorporation protein HypA/HybF